MTVREQDLGVDVVHGCFQREVILLLSIFSWEILQVKLQDN